MAQINIFIVDNYFLIREGIKKSVKSIKNASIVGECNTTQNLIPQIKDNQPDILILEINLCESPILDLVRGVRAVSARTKFLVISDCDCDLPIISSVKAGISGFIRKDVSKDELVKAVLEIAEGKQYFASEVAQLLMKGLSQDSEGTGVFTEREMEILKYICKGRSNEQIADILFLSEKTVATHKRNIMRKAGVKKTSELIVWALDTKMVIK